MTTTKYLLHAKATWFLKEIMLLENNTHSLSQIDPAYCKSLLIQLQSDYNKLMLELTTNTCLAFYNNELNATIIESA